MPIPAALAPWGAAILGAGSSLLSNVFNAREARNNRAFQERMSSTAHQREVVDLRRAGLNPMMSRMGSGASSPSGDRAQFEDFGGKGISSALAAKQAQAQLKLIEAQTGKEIASGLLIQRQRLDLEGGDLASPAAKLELESRSMDLEQRRALLPSVLAKAQEEVRLIGSNARAARARAALDEAAQAGALNLEEFEKAIGEAGPWVKFLHNLLKGLRR